MQIGTDLLNEIDASQNLPATLPPASTGNMMSRASRSALRFIDQLRRAVVKDAEPLTTIGTEGTPTERAKALCDALLSERGEVLGTVIAHDLIGLIESLSPPDRLAFLELLAKQYAPDETAVNEAAELWRTDRSAENLAKLSAVVEAPRQELFRRMNMAPNGMATLVKLRAHLLAQLREHPDFQPVNNDLYHLLNSWFNRGFLELQRIDWNTPASILEKLIEYEAVHAIDGWQDLRRRLAADRRCFAFFHPALPDDPLIFVEVALLNTLADKIEPIIRAPIEAGSELTADTAIFYSISNCQPGLRNVSFGNLLIKQVASDLAAELPNITTFATLSPMPRFRTWLENPDTDLQEHLPRGLNDQLLQETGKGDLREAVLALANEAEKDGYSRAGLLQETLLRLAARYLSGAESERGPSDPVARFHLGNGARIERIDWMADLSPKGVRESHGLMVNYLYDLSQIEVNHEAFANRKPVAVSKDVAQLIDTSESSIMPRSLGLWSR